MSIWQRRTAGHLTTSHYLIFTKIPTNFLFTVFLTSTDKKTGIHHSLSGSCNQDFFSLHRKILIQDPNNKKVKVTSDYSFFEAQKHWRYSSFTNTWRWFEMISTGIGSAFKFMILPIQYRGILIGKLVIFTSPSFILATACLSYLWWNLTLQYAMWRHDS